MSEAILQRLATLEQQIKTLERDFMRVEANQENTDRTLRDIAGLLRDQGTERRLLSKILHVIGWIVAAAIGWFGHGQVPNSGAH